MIAVITFSIGKNREFAKINHSTFKRYAHKVNADFILYKDFNLPIEYSDIESGRENNTSYVSKMAIIYDALSKYEKVLYLDDDCYVSNDCPNLFNFVPDNFMAMHNEGIITALSDTVVNVSNTTMIKNNLKPYTKKNYFNSGVMLVNKKYNYIFSSKFVNNPVYKKLFNCKFVDQTYLNYIVNANHIPYIALSQLFNKTKLFFNDNIEYADKSFEDFCNSPKKMEYFYHIEPDSFLPGQINHAFIYHLTSFWNNNQRLKISNRLKELGI